MYGRQTKVGFSTANFVAKSHYSIVKIELVESFRLTKGRIKARQKKMNQIARLLDIPTSMPHCPTPPNYALRGLRHERKQNQSKN